jgi:hypothetical protein
MTALTHTARRSFLLLGLLISMPALTAAQLISLKTVPIASGDQFMIFPSRNLAMGGVGIALDDPLLDPFVHPAKGGRNNGVPLFGAPTFYNISNDNGGGRTLPAGVLFNSDRWFGGAALAFQQLESGGQQWGFLRPDILPGPVPLRDRSSNNTYAFGTLGRVLPGGKTSIAASVFGASLEAVDGVDLLYALSQNLDQSGSMLDYRVGLVTELGKDRSLELLVLHNRFDMTHDVTYIDVWWDPVLHRTQAQTRLETNLDRTNTWGLHLGYDQPLTETGWRIGGILTGNRKSHPKIPNYEIMNIPRDPGYSWAYNVGLGLSRTQGPAAFGIDFIYEPIWSETWADTDTVMTTRTGRTIEAGGKTVENDFRFSNALLRTGISRENEKAGFQLGLQVRSIQYWLDQYNNLEEARRKQKESWMEWTPSWGAGLKFPEFEVRYMGRVTTGTGRPGVAWTGPRAEAAFAASDFIVAPSGPLTLQEARVLTQQISVSIPIH